MREWLTKLRTSKKLTQHEVANRCFIDRTFYSQIERDTRNPSPDVAEKIASVFEFDPSLFFFDSSVLKKHEKERIRVLQRYQIIDTPPDGAFDRITELAAQLFNVPVSIISLVDEDQIWFKSQ